MSVAIPMKNNRAVFVGIYKITSPSGKVYIGQSWDILSRWKNYEYQSGIHNQVALLSSLRKYGAKLHQFEILDWFSAGCDQKTLDAREAHWMTLHRELGVSLLNIREAGSRGRLSPESIKKIVAARRANGSYIASEELRAKRHASKQSPEAREKNRRAQLGRKRSPETRARMALARAGRKNPWLSEFNHRTKKGKPLSAEHKAKLKAARARRKADTLSGDLFS